MTFQFGIDALLESPADLQSLSSRRVALVAHPASVTSNMQHSLDALIAHRVAVNRAFGPQHGMRGDKQDNMIESADYLDPTHGIPVISLYGEHRAPTQTMLADLDVVAVMDCGVAPGMGNIIFGHHNSQMKIADYECLVGGLPEKREWPYEYQAVFSPIDVIQEYIRPARYVQNSSLIVKEALSDTELIEFDEIGTLESWNSDGLRSLIKTMAHVPNMIEKTLRYPGCVEYLKVLRASGFFSYEKVEVNGTMIRPVDMTAKLLFPKWEMKPGDKDFTIMRIIIKGTENGEEVSYQYNLLDRYQDDTISMARTTGFTCTAVANLVINGAYTRIGISPPEYLGGHFEFVKTYLEKRGVKYNVKKS